MKMKKIYTSPKATSWPIQTELMVAESGNTLNVINDATDGLEGDAREENCRFDDYSW